MAVFSSIGKRFCNQALNDSKPYLFPSRFQFQSIRTLLLQSASESVKVHRHSDADSGIVQINMERPEAKNALGKDMLRGLLNSLEAISTDPAANVLMICSSVSRVFCAGADLKERLTMNVSEVRATVNSLRSTFTFLEALQIPTIAVIEGAALGGGLEMALSCDLRICGEDAKLALPETGLAVIPGAGGTQRLPRLVGKSIAKELIFTGRKISARDALSIGLINYCTPAGEAYSKALEVARDINQKGPVAIRMAKRAINEGLEVNMASGLDVEEECYEQTLHTNDRLEGLAAFSEKRKPLYEGK
ncbi:putative methylglutaconyl-CoA hydratase [Helianthus annuus]|nr:putative methylglutaconyl-CoA hydratase [Helianthus annuus]